MHNLLIPRVPVSENRPVTAEVASSSLVVPAIPSKKVRGLLSRPSRARKRACFALFLCPFSILALRQVFSVGLILPERFPFSEKTRFFWWWRLAVIVIVPERTLP